MCDNVFIAKRDAHLRNKRREVLRRIAGEMPEPHRAWKRDELLPMIDAALARIANGTYGACIDCGEPIPPQRLDRRPESARCVPCQKEAEG